MDKNHHLKIIAAVFAIVLGILFTFTVSAQKIDDWQYSQQQFEPDYMPRVRPDSELIFQNTLFALIGTLVLGWIGFCIFLLIKGKPIITGRVRKMHPLRVIAFIIMFSPFVLIMLMVGLGFLTSLMYRMEFIKLTWLAIPVLIITEAVLLIIYAVKTKAKIALIPIIGGMVLILIISAVVLFYGLTRPVYYSPLKSSALMESSSVASTAFSGDIGLSAGGAKDINNFRQNILNNYLPLPTDITYEGLFYDYYFDTGKQKSCAEIFCPSYTTAISKDPFSGEPEYYLSVGLNSGLKESDFRRKKLNLVVVLDISGSMSSSFDRYYYDRFGNQNEVSDSDPDASKSKMEVATKSIAALLTHLSADDNFGMVLFDGQSYLAKPMRPVGETDMQKITEHILALTPQGSTNMEAGLTAATKLFAGMKNADQSVYENRIIFLTDAMPNTADTSERGLLGITQKNAKNTVYTTFIGIGVDFNTALVESITKIRGANYYSVHFAQQFKERMDAEFEFMVTPLVFDVKLALDAHGFEIEKVYGSPEADEATGEIMKINTLFPSKKEHGQTKGGLVLLKLRKISENPSLKLTVRYQDRQGKEFSNEVPIIFEASPDYYENSGIRKGILLARYANLMKTWILDGRSRNGQEGTPQISVNEKEGIIIPDKIIDFQLDQWERQSLPLTVTSEYQQVFGKFKKYFENEMAVLNDGTLAQEIAILEKLS